MSAKAVRLVFRKMEADEAAIRKSRSILQEFRRADDLDKKWKVGDVLDALLLMTTTRTALKWWFEDGRILETSLREFMELVISEKMHGKPGYLIAPLLDMRCVGVKGFWSAVRQLTESDLWAALQPGMEETDCTVEPGFAHSWRSAGLLVKAL